MLTNQNSIILLALFVALLHSCSSLFYTNSRENDFPRFGKRFFRMAPRSYSGSNVWLAPSSNIQNDYTKWKPEPEAKMNMDAYAWRPILASVEVREDFKRDSFTSSRQSDPEKIGYGLRLPKRLVYNSLREYLIENLRRRHRPMGDVYYTTTD